MKKISILIIFTLILSLVPIQISAKYNIADKKAMDFMKSDTGAWIIDYSYSQGIDPYLIFAIAERESGFRADLIGDHGESYGLMQVQPKWSRERMKRLGVKNLLDPKGCVKIAIDILLEYAEDNNDLYYVLMAYNGGPAYSKRYYETSPSDYALKVTERAAVLTEMYEGARCESYN